MHFNLRTRRSKLALGVGSIAASIALVAGINMTAAGAATPGERLYEFDIVATDLAHNDKLSYLPPGKAAFSIWLTPDVHGGYVWKAGVGARGVLPKGTYYADVTFGIDFDHDGLADTVDYRPLCKLVVKNPDALNVCGGDTIDVPPNVSLATTEFSISNRVATAKDFVEVSGRGLVLSKHPG